MGIEAIRFRTGQTEGIVILQVLDRKDGYGGYRDQVADWRDAQVTDLLDVARFTRDYSSVEREVSDIRDSIANLHAEIQGR